MLLSAKELARELGIYHQTVNELRQERGLPAIRSEENYPGMGIRSRFLYDLDEVREWFARPDSRIGLKLRNRVLAGQTMMMTKTGIGEVWVELPQIAKLLGLTLQGVSQWQKHTNPPKSVKQDGKVYYKVIPSFSYASAAPR